VVGQGELNQAIANFQRKKQLQEADKFSANLPQYIQSQQSQARQQIGQSLEKAQRDFRANENSRGMLFSGRRLKKEAEAAGEANSELQGARQKIVQSALDQQQQLYERPLGSALGQQKAQANQAGLLQQLKDGSNQQNAALFGAGAGLIGQGIGTYAGSRDKAATPAKAGG
jgi:hypothetical protein